MLEYWGGQQAKPRLPGRHDYYIVLMALYELPIALAAYVDWSICLAAVRRLPICCSGGRLLLLCCIRWPTKKCPGL
jgi:hypothetical protein